MLGFAVISVVGAGLLFGMVPVIAKGTSVAVIVPTSIMGTVSTRANATVDLRVAAVAGGCGVLSAIAGGIIADGISPGVSNVMFGILLLFVAGTQFLTLKFDRDQIAVD